MDNGFCVLTKPCILGFVLKMDLHSCAGRLPDFDNHARIDMFQGLGNQFTGIVPGSVDHGFRLICILH